jgi:hypothetical protein
MAAPTIPAPARTPSSAGAALVNPAARKRIGAKVLRSMAALVALGLAGHLIVLLWAQHDLTPVEALVVLHSNMFAHGEGLYWGVNRYPYTISPYGPIFYAASGFLHKWGVPAYQSGRILSYASLLTVLWLCWRALSYLTQNTFAPATAVILAASTANILFWGTTGQVDMLGCCFSLAAFTAFLKFREQRDVRALIFSGILVVLAVFTKQTFVAAGATIGLVLLWEDRKRALLWIPSVVAAGGSIAFALNAVTHGGYFADAIFANINPFALFKLQQQGQYLLLTGAGVIVTALAGARRISRCTAPLYLYTAFASGIWLLTAPKIGSDLNYQVEMMLLLTMCAGVTLDRLDFFPSVFEARRTWVTLLQMPLLLHVSLNLLLTARAIGERALIEPLRRAETEDLKPYVDRPGRVFSGQYDSLVHYRGSIDVEPLIYTILVRAGLTDPEPVRRDLALRQFSTVILDENLFAAPPAARDPELVALPPTQVEAIRENYRLAKHLDGPYGVYIYEPRRD